MWTLQRRAVGPTAAGEHPLLVAPTAGGRTEATVPPEDPYLSWAKRQARQVPNWLPARKDTMEILDRLG